MFDKRAKRKYKGQTISLADFENLGKSSLTPDKSWRDMVVDFKDRHALFISNWSDERHTITQEMMQGTIECVTPIRKQEKTAIIEGVEYDTFGVLHFRVDIGDYYIPVRSNEEVGLLCTPVNRNADGYSQTFIDKFIASSNWGGE